jgi:hypothetical protein
MKPARCAAGFQLVDGKPEAGDPRKMSPDEVREIGHKPMSPMQAIRARCLDCSAGSPDEVRLCAHVECASWPFRMSKNPWREVSEARREAGRAAAHRMRARSSGAGLYPVQNATDVEEGSGSIPEPPLSVAGQP